jgi:hypothetical protein
MYALNARIQLEAENRPLTFNRPRNPSEPDPDWFDQSQAWKAPEIHLDDGRILVLEST